MDPGSVKWAQGGWGGPREGGVGTEHTCMKVYVNVQLFIPMLMQTHTHTHTPDLPQGQVLEPDLGQSPHDPV